VATFVTAREKCTVLERSKGGTREFKCRPK